MRWDERQVALLGAMGIRLWAPEGPGSGAPALPTDPAARATGVEPGPPAARDVRVEPSPAVDPPSLVDAWTWPALAADAERCTACALCAGRTRAVFGSGTPPADWLVVGEPPVEIEDREGLPFAGRPGQLLDNMLRAIGVARDDPSLDPARRACLTLPVKCRPPDNRAPTPDELGTCEARYLQRQVELVRPRLILALGHAAALLLRSEEPLGRLRGRIHRHLGLPLIATYHPSYLLRNPADKARAWDDLCLAAETLREAGSR